MCNFIHEEIRVYEKLIGLAFDFDEICNLSLIIPVKHSNLRCLSDAELAKRQQSKGILKPVHYNLRDFLRYQ